MILLSLSDVHDVGGRLYSGSIQFDLSLSVSRPFVDGASFFPCGSFSSSLSHLRLLFSPSLPLPVTEPPI